MSINPTNGRGAARSVGVTKPDIAADRPMAQPALCFGCCGEFLWPLALQWNAVLARFQTVRPVKMREENLGIGKPIT
jgi:hypothetical protein